MPAHKALACLGHGHVPEGGGQVHQQHVVAATQDVGQILELRLAVVLVDLGLLFEDEDDARLGGLERTLVTLGDNRVIGRLGRGCRQLGTQLDVGEEEGPCLDLVLEERLGVGTCLLYTSPSPRDA